MSASRSELNRSWFDSFARRNDGDDMELNSWSSLELVVTLIPFRYGAILLMIASKAG